MLHNYWSVSSTVIISRSRDWLSLHDARCCLWLCDLLDNLSDMTSLYSDLQLISSTVNKVIFCTNHRILVSSSDHGVISARNNWRTGSTLDMSFKLLHEAQSKLKNIIHNRFDAAVRSGDAASVERFFKTFPLIGEHKAGLEKFSKYLCTQVTTCYFSYINQLLTC